MIVDAIPVQPQSTALANVLRGHGDVFANLLYSGPGADGLGGTPPEILLAESAATHAFMAQRTRAVPSIRVRRHTASTCSVLEIVNDDMPFLVDTVVGEITARGLSTRLVLHPIVKVERSVDGVLLAVTGPGDRNWSSGGQESVMVIHLDPLSESTITVLRDGLLAALEDVRRATGDWSRMLAALDAAVGDIERRPPPVSREALAETLAFCAWLRFGHFTFLGARAHHVTGDSASAEYVPTAASGLGVLRDPSIATITRADGPFRLRPVTIDPATAIATSSGLLGITKSSIQSRVHRRVLMDCITLATFDADGRATGDLRFVGLFTQAAYAERVRDIPVLRQCAGAVLDASGLPPESHTGKTLAAVLDVMPRDEMFQLTMPELATWAHGMVDLDLRPRVRLLTRTDAYGRFVSVLLYMPRDRFTTSIRERIGELLAAACGGRVASFKPFFPEGPLVRVHFIIDTPHGIGGDVVRTEELETRIDELSRSWDERLVARQRAAGSDAIFSGNYAGAFPAGYRDAVSPERAIEDISRIERLSSEAPIAIDITRQASEERASRVRAAIYRVGAPIPLSERVPILENLGFSAIDERSYRVSPTFADGRREVALHDMVLDLPVALAVDLERHQKRLEDTYLAVERGGADNDSFNRLIIVAGATWREAMLMRALAAYLRQIRSPFGPRYIADTLIRHSGIARDLIEVFRTRHDPALFSGTAVCAARTTAADALFARIEGALGGVESLDEDRIMRSLVNVLRAALRTNFFQVDADGSPPATFAIKFDPRMVDGVPSPKPFREIFVYSPRVEGVHLRFGPIARGGLRWSDRLQDYRTEVLGLCKAQQVKNTVIVPTGSKGGFVPKQMPRVASRDDVMREGVASYQVFVSTLLDVTDDLCDGKVVPPDRTVRYDGDDPYLVVAADKGTATFSDHANAIATARGFWLGDAFASGGSAGYDHKKMAITARGAWECVRRHFRELDWDIQTTPFRAIGIGDMSGDVFGNGMLLSPATKLIAAFDHRDIFLDPDPDPAVSLAERKRMFDLPRSSWALYDAAKISAGGGVFSRSAKSIPLSEQVRRMLGVAEERMTPHELMRAILMAETDLLWFGGIGTYVKAATETHEQAGDRANDAIRVTGAELRAKVIGEGANLGLTQRGRMEFASRGGRLNTDFIDNSAGVNSSDQEVNIKIALGDAIAAGKLAIADRNTLLASMTDDVAAACLVNNRQQSLALSLAERRSSKDIGQIGDLMRALERRGLLDRQLEDLPTDRDLAMRETAKAGMTRPELAVLLSWSKIALAADIAATRVPDDTATQSLLIDYFPPALQTRFEAELRRHRLGREIVLMRVTNSVINRGGPTFVSQLTDETGRTTDEIAYAYLAVRSIFMLPELWRDIDALDGAVAGSVQLDLYAATQATLLAETANLLRSGDGQSLGSMIARYRPTAEQLPGLLGRVLAPAQRRIVDAHVAALVGSRVPENIAVRVAALPAMGRVIAIAHLAERHGCTLELAASCQFSADDHLGLTQLRSRADSIAIGDTYDRLALKGAIGSLEASSMRLAGAALSAKAAVTGDALSTCVANQGARLAKAKAGLDRITSASDLTISRVVVAADQVRDALAG